MSLSHLTQNKQTMAPRRANPSSTVDDTISSISPNSFTLVNPNIAISPNQNSRITHKCPRTFCSNYVAANFNFIYKNPSQIDKSKISELNDILFSHTFFSNMAPIFEFLFCVISHQPDDYVCPICLFKPTAPRMTRCGHVFCADCLNTLFEKSKHLCPVCYEPILKKELIRTKLILHPQTVTKYKFKKIIKYSKINICCPQNDSSKPADEKSLLKRTQSQNASSNSNSQLSAKQLKAIESFRKLPKASNPDSIFTRFTLADDDFVSTILGEEIFYIDKQIKEVAEINDLEKIEALKTIRDALVVEGQPEDNSEFQLIPEGTTFSDDFVIFYQIEDGRLIFLDDLNMKMLHDNYGPNSIEDWPDFVEGDVICSTNFTIEQSSQYSQQHQKHSSENEEFLSTLQSHLHLNHLHQGAEVSSVLIDILSTLKPQIAENYRKRIQIRKNAEEMKNRDRNKKKRKNQHVITKADFQTFVSHDETEVKLTSEDFPSLGGPGSSPPVFKRPPPPTKPKEDFPSLGGSGNFSSKSGIKKDWGGITSEVPNEKKVYKEEYPSFEASQPVARKKKKASAAWGNLKL